MFTRLLLVGALALLFLTGNPPLVFVYTLMDGPAHAESNVRNLFDRLLGRTASEGIVKTNGRLEATEVDIPRSILAGWLTSQSRKAVR